MRDGVGEMSVGLQTDGGVLSKDGGGNIFDKSLRDFPGAGVSRLFEINTTTSSLTKI
jgi:hypothetical protein